MADSSKLSPKLANARRDLLSSRSQVIYFTANGDILESCNTLLSLGPGDNLFKKVPFAMQIEGELKASLQNGGELLYPPAQRVINEDERLYSFIFKGDPENDQHAYCMVIDFTPPQFDLKLGYRLPRDLNILVVDDHPINQTLIKHVLNVKGYNYFCAYDGIEALELLEHTHIDVILLDLQMPRMDGIETLAHIRTHLDTPERRYPVIAITASIEVNKLDHDDLHKFDTFISKPPDANLLHETIMELVNSANSQPDQELRLVDLTYLNEVAGENINLIKDLVDIFLKNVPDGVAEMEQMAARKEWPPLKELAHKIKANFKYVGVMRLFELADMIERKAASGKGTENIPVLIASLSEVVADVIKELQTYRRKLESS